MNTSSHKITRLLLLVIALNIPSYAWNDLGHMTVAYVAYQQLKPDTRKRIDELLQRISFE